MFHISTFERGLLSPIAPALVLGADPGREASRDERRWDMEPIDRTGAATSDPTFTGVVGCESEYRVCEVP